MDSFSQILSQCHLDSAKVMDPSADNFYVCEEKQQFTIKQEPFDIEDSNVGLVGDFLQGEDSIDIDAYLALGRAEVQQNNHVDNTGDGILRQLEQNFASNHQQMLTHTPAPTPGAQPNQQPVHSVDQLHYTINNMPQQNTQAHVVEQAVPEYQPCWEIHSTSNSAASSPGLPTSGDSYNEEVQIQADSGTASGSGGGSQKRKRPVPTPGTHEYKQKRERNNIAVRKSREKTKTKNKELQDKVGELQEENTGLKKRVEGLAKELAVLRSLFTTTGKTPPSALDKAVK